MALDSRLRGRDEPIFALAPFAFPIIVIPDLIRDPGQQAHLVRAALDTRLRGRDELVLTFAPFAFLTFVIPDVIRDPGRQERLVRVALNTRQQGDGEGDACSVTLCASR